MLEEGIPYRRQPDQRADDQDRGDQDQLDGDDETALSARRTACVRE
jgi:hypothetical protein